MRSVSVVIVEDEPLVLAGIVATLEPYKQIKVVGQGSVGEHVVKLVKKHRPDVLLLDQNMPQVDPSAERQQIFNAAATIRLLKRKYPQTHIIIVSYVTSAGIIKLILDAGADGYVTKSEIASANLGKVIEEVMENGFYLSPYVLREMGKLNAINHTFHQLTEKNIELLVIYTKNLGKPMSVTARELGISENTLRNTLAKIRHVFGAKSTSAAVQIAINSGIVAPPRFL